MSPSMVNIFQLDTRDTVCPEHSLGMYFSQTFKSPTSDRPCVISSSQIVADMIMCDKAQKKWDLPEWLPDRYLTENRFGK